MLLDANPEHRHIIAKPDKILYRGHSETILQQSYCFQEYIIATC